MYDIATIPNKTTVTSIRYTPIFSAICEIGGTPFFGAIEIIYSPGNLLFDLHSFEAFLASLANKEFIAETLCSFIFDILFKTLTPENLQVTVNASSSNHANISVTRNLYIKEKK